MIKKAVSVLLSIVMVICPFSMTQITVNAKGTEILETSATSGITGDCKWSLDGTLLTISGNGRMADYSKYGPVPWNLSNITEVVIEDGVLNIGKYAFSIGEHITSVTIGNSVVSIGEGSFYDCINLTSITVPDSIINIDSAAFYFCMSLENITLGNHVSSIGNSAFANCSSLTSINIPDTVTNIGTSCFSECKNLTSLAISDSISSIGRSFCSGCKNLESIIIPNSVTEINGSAFDGCVSLKIYAYDDSYAHTYAVQNNIPFVSLGKKSPPTKKTGNIIYFDAASAGWNYCSYVGFYICTDSGYQLSMWGSRNTYGDEIANGVWRYDLDNHGISLDSSNRYTVIFFSDYGRTNELALDITCYGDTAYCDGTESPNPANTTQYLLTPFWEHHKRYINILGDVDCDGDVTIIDATVIQRHLAEIPVVSYNENTADADEDGSVTIIDATSIQRYLAELKSNENIGKPSS